MSASKKKKGGGSTKKDDDGRKMIARNRRARFEYLILDTFEAGLVLTGTEVKSLRTGEASIQDAYARIDRGEVWLLKMFIPEYSERGYANHEPRRKRKLLLHKREIRKLVGKLAERGLTLVPTCVYFRNGYAKVELGLGKGKKIHDKRESMKKKSSERELRQRMAR